MDQRHYSRDYDVEERPAGKSSDDFIDLDRLLTIAMRRAGLVIACTMIALAIGIAYLIVAPRSYSAQTSILLDNDLAKYASDQPTPAPQAAQTDTDMASQMQILTSQQLALTVVDKLALDKNNDFLNPPMSPVAFLKNSVKSIALALLPQSSPKSGRPDQDPARLQAAAMLQQNLDVEREGRSMVLDVTYTAGDPDLAAQITRAYADAYLSDQLNANFDATQRATVWLQQRLGDLKDSAQKASMAAARYKAENGLTETKGQLVSEQQLSDLNSQLILAQADLATASARYNQYKAIIEAGPKDAVANATVSAGDATDNTVLSKLKSQYLNVANRADAIEARFGKQHPQVISLRQQQEELAGQIYQELQQLTTSYKNASDVAQSRVDSLQKNISHLTSETSDANRSLVHLKELEQRSDALNQLYQSFLSRYEEASQQQTFPIAKARVISEAGVPTSPSSPSKKVVLGLSLVLGLMIGGGLGAFAEFRERSFRTEDEVRSALDVKFLGYLPALPDNLVAPPAEGSSAAGAHQVLGPAMRVAAEKPGSSYAETLRTIKLAADIVLAGRSSKVIGVISALPREGKTTVAANLASLLASTGSKTLLIDADLRNPGLSRQIKPAPTTGLVEAVTSGETWIDSLKIDPTTHLAVLPSVTHRNLKHTSEFLSSRGVAELIESARGLFDYIIIDLPPSRAVVDARAIEPLTDAFVAVARWGETPRALLKSVLDADPRTKAKTLGAVLNRTDMRKLARYAPLGGSERYIERYAAYYNDKI